MRVLVALLLLAGLAHADASLPSLAGQPAWTLPCIERFEQARAAAGNALPIMRQAKVYIASREFDEPGNPAAQHQLAVVELRLDESLLGGGPPLLVSAQVSSRQSSWSAPPSSFRWEGNRRQTPHFEAEIVLHRAPPGTAALVDAVLRPAIDACLIAAERAAR